MPVNSDVAIAESADSGAAKVATYSITEDALVKDLERVVLNDPAGANAIGTVGTPEAGTLLKLVTDMLAATKVINDTGITATNAKLDTANVALAAMKSDLDSLATDTSAAAVIGSIASGSPSTAAPVPTGGRAATANPTPVADGQVVQRMHDKIGREAVVPHQVRDLAGDAAVTVTSTTTAADLLAAGGAGVFNDLLSITLNNSSATDTVVQILNADGTTVRWTGTAKANDMRGIVFPSPLKNAAANAKWMIKTVTSVASLVATVQYAINV